MSINIEPHSRYIVCYGDLVIINTSDKKQAQKSYKFHNSLLDGAVMLKRYWYDQKGETNESN